MTSPTNGVAVAGLTKSFPDGTGTRDVLVDVTAGFAPGIAHAVVGPSGCGKSTLLHCIGQVVKPDRGSVTVDGQSVDFNRWRVPQRDGRLVFGFVHQEYALLEDTTALDNVVLPLRYQRIKGDREAMAREALARVGLRGRVGERVSRLSGGERQRVAIARTLAARPRVVLADEPTGALDEATAHEVVGHLLALRDEGVTVLIASHDLALVDRCDARWQVSQGCLTRQ